LIPESPESRRTDAEEFRAAELIHLVADLFDLDLSNVLSAQIDHELEEEAVSERTFGGLTDLRLGRSAFQSTAVLRAALEAAQAANGTEPDPHEPVLPMLTPKETAAAITFNRGKLKDPAAIRIMQEAVGAAPDGDIGPATVNRIAALQLFDGEATGKLDAATMRNLHKHLVDRDELHAATRLAMAYWKLGEVGLLDIAVDNDVRMGGGMSVGAAVTLGFTGVRSNSIIRLRSSTFSPYEKFLATLVHELEHVEQTTAGSTAREPVLEFEGHSAELLEAPLPLPDNAFFDKAALLLVGGGRAFWKDMSDDERRGLWTRFVAVRNAVRVRFNQLDRADQERFQEIMDAYQSEPEPPRAPAGGD
jgi:hypothetical protein